MTNRVWLALTGLALLGVGGSALAAGWGAFGRRCAHRPIWTAGMSRWMPAHGWFWPVVAVTAGAVGAMGAGWLISLGRGRRLRRLAIGDTRSGATRMAARVAVRTVLADVTAYDGVRDVRARLTGRATGPRVLLRVTCAADADLAGLGGRIRGEALTRLRAALARDDITGVVIFRVVRDRQEAGAA
ncbi:alkaline shock response membrane anchor protein AmaP [Actinoallomurus purpureus]|uniref:alkaline shock response membrane anchor protein AmaP n=1 Tax=Actinoallomurus purpureus TaxID=478114 RepID=UPI0020925FDA|nr:alkaline shock response membrane anchor protein AmaP [Actinoallomurus purpureus]MCO6008726.1 alkaline shock response membrane anchor protein AmaP [Actinoallomurus purpureus]